MFVIALCKVQTVGFEKLANAFDSEAMAASSLRRIQRFIAQYALDSDLVARLIFGLLPNKERLKLSIDRTNWKFGQTNINIFMLGVTYKGVAFPLLFKMLDKRGNSNCSERIEFVNRFIKLFGTNCIECLMADREFVGDEWIKFLNDNNIRYYIRIRNNFKICIAYQKESKSKIDYQYITWLKIIVVLFVFMGLFEGVAIFGIYNYPPVFILMAIFLLLYAFYFFIFAIHFSNKKYRHIMKKQEDSDSFVFKPELEIIDVRFYGRKI